MGEIELKRLLDTPGVGPHRQVVAKWIESKPIQSAIIAVILINAALLGLETSSAIMERWQFWIRSLDWLCLGVFIIELSIKLHAYRGQFWRSGWNVFDFLVVAVALLPGAGVWSVLRSLRVLRVLRLLTVIPSLRKVVAAFLHAIPGLAGVVTVMAIFFYTAAVLATRLFGSEFPQWFGNMGESLFTLFQIMTLESWAMGIVRPVMDSHPWAWAFFVPFIIIATFTILNLFIGIIVSTMQELSLVPDTSRDQAEMHDLLKRMEEDLRTMRGMIAKGSPPDPG